MLRQTVFAVGGTTYDWSDVVLAAKLRGEWADLEAEARLGLACLARAEDSEEEPDHEAVESAANEFRYERDLVSAEEMEAWLARWGLTDEAWMTYIEGSVARRESADEAEEIVGEYEVADEDVEAVLWCEAVCSGRLARWAQDLAARAAVHQRAAEEGAGAGDGEIEAEARRLLESAPADLAHPRLPTLARLEVTFRRFVRRAVTPRAIQEQIDARHLDWIRFDCRCLALPDEQMAREAALSVREDGLALEDVAAQAKMEVQEARRYLEDLPPDLRDRFLGARAGDLLGPLRWGEEHVLFLVVDKALPAAEDADTRRRAARAVVTKLLGHEVSARITWHSRL